MDTIIVPTDFSPAASNAVDYAVEIAKFFNAKIILVHAYPLPPVSYEISFASESISVTHKVSEKRLRDTKRAIHKKYGTDIPVDCVSDMGSPYEVISATADVMNADLIVIGIVGESGILKEHLIGSTAVTVARKQEIPTFIIPENVKYSRIHKISFACDLKHTEETDLMYVAKFFSKVFDAELEIVNVGDPAEEITSEKAATYMYVENKLQNVKHKTMHVIGKDIVKELEDYFKIYPTDVIMLNPKKHNVFYYLFNHSVTHNLAFHSKLPILAIH